VDTGNSFDVTYGTGHVSGHVVTDTLVIAGLSLNAHTFGVATTESVDFSSSDVPFDGIMGLSQSVSSSSVGRPVVNLNPPV
jgi:hypothetical protein